MKTFIFSLQMNVHVLKMWVCSEVVWRRTGMTYTSKVLPVLYIVHSIVCTPFCTAVRMLREDHYVVLHSAL